MAVSNKFRNKRDKPVKQRKETYAQKRASDIQDRIFYVLLALVVIEFGVFVLGDGVAWQVIRLVRGGFLG